MAEDKNKETLTARRDLLAAGAGLLAAGAAGPAAAQQEGDYPVPGLAFAFQADIDLGPIQELGVIDGMRRRIVPIVGGVVSGPRFRGAVMPGGADWQGVRPSDSLTRVWARYWLKAEDGAAISVQNEGLRRGSPEVMKRLMAGERVGPKEYYFRAAPVIEAGEGPHQWMNETVFICTGARGPNKAIIRFYAVT